MITGAALLNLLVGLVIGGLIAWLLIWFIDYVGLPEPINKVAKVIIGLVIVIWLINLLMGLGVGRPFWVR